MIAVVTDEAVYAAAEILKAWGLDHGNVPAARAVLDGFAGGRAGYSDADALRDLQESILQSTTLADFMAVKKTVEAIRASEKAGATDA